METRYQLQFTDHFGVKILAPCHYGSRDDARRMARYHRCQIGRDGSTFCNFSGGFVALDVRVVPVAPAA